MQMSTTAIANHCTSQFPSSPPFVPASRSCYVVYWSGYKQAYIYIYWIFINDLFLGIPSNTHTIHVYANKLIIINGWILYVFDQISEAHSDRMQMNVCFDSFVYRAHTAHARAHNNWLRMVRIGRLSAKRYTNTLRWAMSNNTRTRTRGQIYWHEKSLRIWLPNRSSSRKRFADYSHYIIHRGGYFLFCYVCYYPVIASGIGWFCHKTYHIMRLRRT